MVIFEVVDNIRKERFVSDWPGELMVEMLV